ncbi:MAG: DUF1048 domain-containing protein [Bifidobacteriaceae bacterium]|nr:DUF1048 domain-containing protein [Bifidobacteriaceae bacterium]
MLEYIKRVRREKREYRQMRQRARALPADYAYVYERLERYLWQRAAGNGMDIIAILADVVELFESGAAQGQDVLAVTGVDVAAFADELLRSAKTYTADWHEALNRDIHRKLGRGEVE